MEITCHIYVVVVVTDKHRSLHFSRSLHLMSKRMCMVMYELFNVKYIFYFNNSWVVSCSTLAP